MKELSITKTATYAIAGSMGSNIAFVTMMMFFMYYATEIFGIDPMTVGTIMLVARMVDCFSDPLMGAIADRTVSKKGKYRFWVFWTGPLTGLTLFLVFASPDLTMAGRIFWMYFIYIAYSLISTATNIPYHSLSAYAFGTPTKRNTAVMLKQFTAIVAGFLVQIFAFPLVTAFGGGVAGFRAVGIIIGLLIAVFWLICAWSVKDVDTEARAFETKDSKRITFGELFGQLKFIFRNKSLFIVTISCMANTFAMAIVSAITIYFWQYVMGNAALLSLSGLVNFGATILSLFIIIPLISKVSNRMSFTITSALAAIPGILFVILFQPTIGFTITMLAIIAFFNNMSSIIPWVMVIDVADEILYEEGVNAAGIASSGMTFANKLGTAIGGWATGAVLVLIGFQAGSPTQSTQTINGLILAIGLLPACGHLVSVIMMKFYPLGKERVTMIRNEIHGAKTVTTETNV